MIASQGWADRAACLVGDPEVFFAPDGERGDSPARVVRIAAAKAVCRSCIVRAECLTYAVNTLQRAGVWGGLTEDERKPLRTRKGRS